MVLDAGLHGPPTNLMDILELKAQNIPCGNLAEELRIVRIWALTIDLHICFMDMVLQLRDIGL